MHPHEQLEQRLEKTPWVGGKYAVACNSGTAALHLALEALQLPPGEVIVPNYCMVAVARAVVLAGHTPVFVDCHPDTLLTDNDRWPLMVDATKYRATMVVHNYGREAYRPYDTMIIEDLAEAHGIVPDLRSVACWSFYKNKIVAGQEGGAVAFPKRKQADLARQLRCIGFTPEHDYTHIPRGHNYRLADSLVPPIMWSLDYFDRNVFDRKEWASQLEGVAGRIVSVGWMLTLRLVIS